jgi:serine/threonine-protein kinase
MLQFTTMVRRVLLAGLSLAVFSTCAGVVFWYALVHTVHRGTLAVPDFTSASLIDAEQRAHDLGLVVRLGEDGVFSATVSPGGIAAQDPHPGFHVKTGSAVTVWLSLGSETATVPDVRGESLPSALRLIEQVGLRPGHRAQVRAQADADTVIATSPTTGRRVAPDSEVDVLVNVSPRRELWVMPSLLSRSLDSVRRFCRHYRLRLGQVHDVAYSGVPSGIVLRQYPPAGSPLSPSDIVSVWVSR